MDEPIQNLQREFSRGVAFLEQGVPEAALECFFKAQRLHTRSATLYLYAGVALHELKRFKEAVHSYHMALQIEPESGEAHNNMGNSLLQLGQFEQAVKAFSKASSLLPGSPVPVAALASALLALGRVNEAESCCRNAVAIAPEFAEAHWNLALCFLLRGDLREGWQEYEWRWKRKTFTSPVRHEGAPCWDGSPLNGKTIILHAEQGFGDAIQFVRYAPLVARRGGNVILECHPQLVSLFRTVEGVQAAVPFNSPLPAFSCHIPLLSLPKIFETVLETIPAVCPYVTIPSGHRDKWASLMGAYPQSVRIGLVWAGKDYPDPLRSCRLSEMGALARIPATFFSLQVGCGAEQAAAPPSGMNLIDLTSNIHDFADTAALIEHLDLVISIDTAVAHLAGALGKPTWLLLPFAADWRWLLERCDSPWYPTMSIFRQEAPGGWDHVIRNIAAALSPK